jgi:hypothetical protein
VTRAPTFELLDIDLLRIHEQIQPEHVARLVEQLRRDGFVADPIWVSRDTHVVLNGHHRFAALRALGARKVPAWVFDYDSDAVLLDRWTPGPPLSKGDVVARASGGDPFPPKTTRHTVVVTLPERRTPLTALGVPDAAVHGGEGRRSTDAVRALEGS